MVSLHLATKTATLHWDIFFVPLDGKPFEIKTTYSFVLPSPKPVFLVVAASERKVHSKFLLRRVSGFHFSQEIILFNRSLKLTVSPTVTILCTSDLIYSLSLYANRTWTFRKMHIFTSDVAKFYAKYF